MSFSKGFAHNGNDIILCYLVGGLRHFAMWNKRPRWTDFLVKSRILSRTVGKCIDNQTSVTAAQTESCSHKQEALGIFTDAFRFTAFVISAESCNRHPAKHRLLKFSMCTKKYVSKLGSFRAWICKMATQSIRDTQ